MRVLVVNAGSSSLKLRVVGGSDEVAGEENLDAWDGAGEAAAAAIDRLIDRCGAVAAVGHRVVHGGERDAAALVDDALMHQLGELSSLAPLHQPRALDALAAARRRLPDVAHVACFDTAFHRSMPERARTYALPQPWRERWPLWRHGFHGLSHAAVARRAPMIAAAAAKPARIVSCHLGAGASLCAIEGGRSVDTTMGFTPLEGLVMATRSGSVDPGLVLWLLRQGLDVDDVSDGLERHGGLAGLSGTSGDMRAVLAARDRGDAAAALAFEVYLHRLRREIAAMAAALGGVDVLAFTGGIGEHSPVVRGEACAGLGFLGIALDTLRNDATESDGDIAAADAKVRCVVVTAREDLQIATEVRSLLKSDPLSHAHFLRAGEG
ncbi:MAG TPA: acetate/propionate family kinase [Terriglobales bacterium]|nr:acetate/propionate family kinase [Terriglobales bacterium]